jgi:hypothetical protein
VKSVQSGADFYGLHYNSMLQCWAIGIVTEILVTRVGKQLQTSFFFQI